MNRKLIITTILLLNIFTGYSQWTQTNGPYGTSNVLAAFKHDSSYFASIYLCGFFSKSSTENYWNLNSKIYFKTYTIKGDSLFADAHYHSGMSRNMGVQLFDLHNPESPPISVNTITSKALKHTDTCLFGGNETAGFFKLSFDGSVLEYYNNGLPTDTIWDFLETYFLTNVSAIETTDDYIFSGTKYGVYRSDANLSCWEEINNGISKGEVTLIEDISDTLYTSIDTNLYYSIDDGNNWFLIYSAPSKITSFQKVDCQMLVSTVSNGVYNSIDNGINWYSMNSGLTDLSVNFITKQDSVIFCGSNTKGVFKYNNGIWLDENSGIICSSIRSMTVTNDKVIANTDEKVYKLDTNRNWINISPIVDYELFGSVNSMGDTIFLSVEYDSPRDNPFILYSIDYGITWSALVNPVPFVRDDPYKIYCENGRLYAREDEIMYYTDNLGLHWTDLSLPSQFCNYFDDFVIYNSQPFAAACGDGELLKLDNNYNWILTNNGLPSDKEVEDLAFCDDALFAYIFARGVYVSFDNGNNWSYANNGLEGIDRGIRDFTYYRQNLFISTEDGVFFTTSYGQNWYTCNDGLKNTNTSEIKLLNDTLYVGTYGNGIWKRAIGNIYLSLPEYNTSKYDIKIYPNPAADYLIITEKNIDYKYVRIVDLMGKHILSEKMNTNRINIQNIPNGIYILELSSGEKIYNTKIIINR